MRAGFVGRAVELGLLGRRLARIASDGTGLAVAIRGRRQVGKSRLVQEFCDRSHVPYVFYTATRGASPTEAVGAFLTELRDSGLPRDRDLVPVDSAAGWPDAFRALQMGARGIIKKMVKGENGGPKLAKLGHYNDILIREAGRWRFLRREAPADIG